ncbi:MAG: DUF2953 domain-containing protein [Betaproteobacteria bacterium]|nr:MAG: DUF2953 domain-containing protein [Betaproteobacteria bacterium]
MSPARSHLPNPIATDYLVAGIEPYVVTALLILSALFALFLLLLAVPIDLAFRIEGVRTFQGHMSLRWLFGVVRFRIPVPDSAAQRPEAKVSQRPTKKRSIRKKRRKHLNFVAVLKQAEFRRRAYRFAKDLIHAVHVQRLRLLMRLGLGDPADTGRLWALVGPLSAMAQNLQSADVRIEPEFMDSVLEVRADGQLRLVPLQFLGLAIAFLLSPTSIRAWRTLRASHA